MAVKGVFPLQDDQGADLFPGKVGGGLGDDLRAFIEGGNGEDFFPETAQQGQTLEKAAEVLLKNDDKDEQQDREKGLQGHVLSGKAGRSGRGDR